MRGSESKRRGSAGRRAWRVAVGAATVAGAAIALNGPAVAADPPATALPPGLIAQADTARSFSIAPQPLASALDRFAEQAGVSFAYRSGDLSTLRSPGISGSLTPREALQRLLVGTGITFSFTGPTTITLARAPDAGGTMQLDPVQVQGAFPVPPQALIDNTPPPYAGGQVATGGQLGLLGNRPVMDTPFNQTNFTAKKAQDQQAKTVRDVLIDDPSVRSSIADGTFGADSVRIRGFIVIPENTSYAGLYGILPSRSIMAELAERVEVLKGPSVMLNGMPPFTSIGGTINIVPKRAPDEGLVQFTANYASAGQLGGHVDLAHRFGADKQFGVRFNGVFRAGQTAVENNSDQRGLGILGLDFRGDHVRLSADIGYQHRYVGGMMSYLGVNPGVPLPWAPDARKNQGQPWSYVERKDFFGVVRAEIDMTESITAYAAVGAHDAREGGLFSALLTSTSFSGAATAGAPQNSSTFASYLTATAGVRALFDTGPIGHEFAATAMTYENVSGFGETFGTAFASNIYNPTIIARPIIATPVATKASSLGVSSLGFADTLTAADKRIQLTAGLRLQNVTAQNFNTTSGRPTTGYNQSAVSPAVALVFKPWENVSVYGNWIQGLQQGSVVGAQFRNAGEIFPPFVTTQFETGVKVDWGKFTTTASLFQITQPFTLTNVASNTLVLAGEQRNQGLELNVFGEPAEGVRLLGGAMFLSPVLVKTQGNVTDGWIAPFSPQVNVNLAGEWDLPFVPGLTLTGRVVYTGSQYIDTTFPRRSLPEWTRFDLGVRYTFENPGAKGKLLIARFNVDNVLDADYWQGGNVATQLFLGAPRTFRVSLTADF